MTRIAVFVGSLHDGSINKQLAHGLEKLLPEGINFDYVDINLPLYNQDLEQSLPAEVSAMKDIVEAADGVLFVTPEYNRSFPGVLKNAIDWASRPWGSNSFDGKPTGVVGMSIGPLGTSQAQQQLRNVLVYLNTKLLGQPEVYGWNKNVLAEDGTIIESATDFLQQYVDAFLAHVEAHKAAEVRQPELV